MQGLSCPVHPRIPAAHLELSRSAPPGPQGIRSRNQETRKRMCSEASTRRPRGPGLQTPWSCPRAVTRQKSCAFLRRRGWAWRNLPDGTTAGDKGSTGCLTVTFRVLRSLRSLHGFSHCAHSDLPPRLFSLTCSYVRVSIIITVSPWHLANGKAPSGPLSSSTHGVPPALHWPQEHAA